jgi:GntR family transcriptional regulator/MocR family aminotransferase
MYGIAMDPASPLSQYRQLVDQLREGIASGRIEAGCRLSSSRDLAEGLGLSRAIVLEAFDQLRVEGYIETVGGSGAYVRKGVAWKDAPQSLRQAAWPEAVASPAPRPSSISFAPGLPDLSLFPRAHWLGAYRQAIDYATAEDLGYAPLLGREDLRREICRYLFALKGIRAQPESVVVTAGASQAFGLLADLFSPARVVMEDPQAAFVRRVFQRGENKVRYAPVDEEGIIPHLLPRDKFDLLYLTPAHQFPVGGTLSAERRVQTLAAAKEAGAFIIEDDFDGELRYDRHPVAPLQVMSPERVVYVGSFSKILSPALRLGFAVIPQALLPRVKLAKLRWDLRMESLQQKALAIFISEGHLERHLRRSHRAYREKNAALRGFIERELSGRWRPLGATTGLHLVLRRASGQPAEGVAASLLGRGFSVPLVSEYCQESRDYRDSLILAYGERSLAELQAIIHAIREVDG